MTVRARLAATLQAFLIFVFAAAASAQSVTLAPAAAPAQNPASLAYTGFNQSDDTFEMTFNGTSVGSCVYNEETNAVGCSYTVPNVAPGPYAIAVYGCTGAEIISLSFSTSCNDSSTATFNVISGVVIPSVSSGSPGTLVTVTGSGFPISDKTIKLTFSGYGSNIPTGGPAVLGCPADGTACFNVTPSFGCPLSGGSFSCAIVVPALEPNADSTVNNTAGCTEADYTALFLNYRLAATSESGAEIYAGFIVTQGTGFQFSPAVAGSANLVLGGGYCGGVSFTLTVGGQTAGSYNYLNSFYGTPQSMTCDTYSDQVFCSFTVPALPPGTYPATFTGYNFLGAAVGSFNSSLTIVANPGIELKDSASCGALGAVWSAAITTCNLVSTSELTLNSGFTLTIDPGVTLIVPPSLSFTNNGTIINSGTIGSGGFFTNGPGATMYVYPGGTISNAAFFNNYGTIYSNLASTGGLATGTFVNSGTFTNAGYMDAQPGTVTNNGSIVISVASGSCIGAPYVASGTSPFVLLGVWGGDSCTVGLTNPLATALDQALTVPVETTLQIQPGTTLVNQGTMFVHGAIQNLGAFLNQGSISNGGYLANTGVLSVDGTVNNSGNLANQSGIFEILSGGVATNQAGSAVQMVDAAGGTISVNPGGTLTNYASIDVDSSSTIVDEGLIKNFGIINNQGTIDTRGAVASISNLNPGSISNAGSGNTDGVGGTITGTVGTATVTMSPSSCTAIGASWISATSTCVVGTGKTVSIAYSTNLQIGAGVTLDNFGEIDVYGGIDTSGAIVNQSTGFLYVGPGDGLGNLTVENSASVSNFGFISMPQSGSALSNSGTVINGTSGLIQNQGSVTNAGNVQNFGSIQSLNIVLNTGGIVDKCGGSVSGQVTGNPPIAALCTSIPLEPVILALTASPNPSASGLPVTLTATVAPLQATGSVTFLDGSTTLGQANLSAGSASITASLTAGPHSLTASYAGDSLHAPGTSAPFGQTVTSGPLYNMPEGVAAGDFNGDGIPDLAVADFNGDTVSILLGNGDGTFQPPVAYSVGNGPETIAIGDFNADGAKDLAVLNFTDGTVSVLLGNGNGTFQAQNPYGAAFLDSPVFVAAADFNHDGKTDLVVANNASTKVAVMLAQGNGAFPSGTLYTSGLGPDFIAIGDFNHDGNPDLAVANYYGTSFESNGSLSALIGNIDGTFQPPAVYGSGTLNRPISVAIGDFNSDGQPDLAVTNVGGGGIMLLQGNTGGTFQASESVGAGNGPLAAGDFNADGMTDLVAINSANNSASVLLGNGNGTFQTAASFATGADPVAVAVADLNRDGASDFVTANAVGNSLTVVLGTSPTVSVTVNTSPAGQSFSVDGVTYTQTQILSWTTGTMHTLTTTAVQPGGTGTQFQFASWSDNGTLSHTVTASAGTTGYTATFNPQYLLTSGSSPDGGGTVSASPSAAVGYYGAGTSVKLTAVAADGYAFSGWAGNLTGAVNPQSITMNGPVAATASFMALPQNISLATNPSGLAVSVDGGTPEAAPFIVSLTPGPHTIAVAAIQAGTPVTRYVFTGWSDSGAVSHSITVASSPASYTATFQTQYQLTTAASPSVGGTVTPASGAFYNAGSVVSVQESANSGYQFANFSGSALTGSANPQNVTLNGPANVVANFTLIEPSLSATGGTRTVVGSDVQMTLTLSNNSLVGTATNATITSITAIGDTSGTGTVTLVSGTPINLGTIAAGASSAPTTVTFSWPSTAVRIHFTVNMTADGGYTNSTVVNAIY